MRCARTVNADESKYSQADDAAVSSQVAEGCTCSYNLRQSSSSIQSYEGAPQGVCPLKILLLEILTYCSDIENRGQLDSGGYKPNFIVTIPTAFMKQSSVLIFAE